MSAFRNISSKCVFSSKYGLIIVHNAFGRGASYISYLNNLNSCKGMSFYAFTKVLYYRAGGKLQHYDSNSISLFVKY